ncbi:IS110 family transposase [Paracoccus onubensis]|nr:IS110 family transposase [Paracoccus onubensis]MDP0930194.1 IS110 family transposase [Paracoccus onubensis]
MGMGLRHAICTKLIAPVYVKPYIKRGKYDAADAEAICEAVTRPTMRFVEVKSPEQQAILSLHRARSLIVRQRTQTINMLRGLLAEFGIIFAQGVGHAVQFARCATQGQVLELPPVALDTIIDLSEQLLSLRGRVNWYGRKLAAAAKSEPRIVLLQTIPGIGPITASAVVATVGSAEQFRCGRDFSAWLGLTPINRSTGGKERLGRISKMGDRYIRHLMVVGMTSRMKQIKNAPERFDPWFTELLARKPAKLAAVAMANKTARIIWAVLTRNEPYRIRTA